MARPRPDLKEEKKIREINFTSFFFAWNFLFNFLVLSLVGGPMMK